MASPLHVVQRRFVIEGLLNSRVRIPPLNSRIRRITFWEWQRKLLKRMVLMSLYCFLLMFSAFFLDTVCPASFRRQAEELFLYLPTYGFDLLPVMSSSHLWKGNFRLFTLETAVWTGLNRLVSLFHQIIKILATAYVHIGQNKFCQKHPQIHEGTWKWRKCC